GFETFPNRISHFEEHVDVGEGARRDDLVHPRRRAAAGAELGGGLGDGERVEAVEALLGGAVACHMSPYPKAADTPVGVDVETELVEGAAVDDLFFEEVARARLELG